MTKPQKLQNPKLRRLRAEYLVARRQVNGLHRRGQHDAVFRHLLGLMQTAYESEAGALEIRIVGGQSERESKIQSIQSLATSLSDKVAPHELAGIIARRVGCTPKHVRAVLAKKNEPEHC